MRLRYDNVVSRCVATVMAGVAIWAMTLAGYAQEPLEQEITVKHNEEVKPKDAVRLNVAPTVTMPALKLQNLGYGTRQVRASVVPSVSLLAPAAYADTIYRSPYAGYASAGYLPGMNLEASAGYKFVDNDHMRLNGWLQYDGESYRGDMAYLNYPLENAIRSMRVRQNTLTLGAAMHSAVGRKSYLDMGVDYTFSRYNMPALDRTEHQNVNRVNVQGLWSMPMDDWSTSLGVSYGHFGFSNLLHEREMQSGYKPLRDNVWRLTASASGAAFGADKAGLDVNLSYVDNRGGWSAESHALLNMRPYYRMVWKKVDLDLGVDMNVTFNNGRMFHIAPAAQATWRPSNYAAVYVKAQGGERQNTLGSVYDISPYILHPYILNHSHYKNSHVPLDVEVGVTVGLFRGFYASLAAEYAVANDWLMPEMWGFTTMDYVNMRGYKLHFSAGYDYKGIVKVDALVECAPQKKERGYYMWRDRARYVGHAAVEFTPIKPLDVSISWDYRGRRLMYSPEILGGSYERSRSLGNVNSLNLGGRYRLSGQWTVWGNLENILSHRYVEIGGMYSAGFHGLLGATYKF